MISEQFKVAVQSKEIEKVKIMLKNSLTMDLTFNQFKEMLDYALKYFPNIIEKHEGEKFESKDNWDKEYASSIKVDLVDNFSAERIEHIKEVQTYVYADEIARKKQAAYSQGSISSAPKGSVQTRRESATNADSQSMATLIASLGVGAASILFGVIKGLSIVTVTTTAVVASCVIGGVTYYLVKKS
ncbi:hypothetical protein [Domibacillus aminovorans]|uniref:Uncharacterized protein n=1 Tax=Domibacillus aminovorans TaxID=29332 RepID=A0A177L7R2_9BACI|nr:hypothetical protein [Domibacillus aminovorans]OAH61613.1 hypothetical protein AWH49_11730 [Domibacillus aminovorans]